jgi:hypothetical protein
LDNTDEHLGAAEDANMFYVEELTDYVFPKSCNRSWRLRCGMRVLHTLATIGGINAIALALEATTQSHPPRLVAVLHCAGDWITGYTRCIAINPIHYSPVSDGPWKPTSTSYPVPAQQSIQGGAWIPLLLAPPSMSTVYYPPATFHQFLAQFEPWETQLFPELHMAVDCYKFLDLVNSQQIDDTDNTAMHLITVSKGSNDSGSMTFGWVIALPEGRCLARCSGPAFGPSGSSFQAEGYGFLLRMLLDDSHMVDKNDD